jgi:hypothetical protein
MPEPVPVDQAAEPNPALLAKLQTIALYFPAIEYDAEDRPEEIAAVIEGARRCGLIAIPSTDITPRTFRGVQRPPAPPQPPVEPEKPVDLAKARTDPPLPGLPVRTSHTDSIWTTSGDGEWSTRNPNGTTWICSWDDIAGGKYGTVEILIPVPYRGDNTLTPTVAELATFGIAPAMDAMTGLANALAGGFVALLAEAERRGRAAGAAVAARGRDGAGS